MNGYSYDSGFDADTMASGGVSDLMMGVGQNGMEGQSLDDIVSQNAKPNRRQSMPPQYQGAPDGSQSDLRRVSLADYADASPSGHVGPYRYDLDANAMAQGSIISSASPDHPAANVGMPAGPLRRPSQAELSLNTSFPSQTQSPYGGMMSSHSAFPTSAHPQSAVDMAMGGSYFDNDVMSSMEYGPDSTFDMQIASDNGNADTFSAQPPFVSSAMSSPMNQRGGMGTPGSTGIPHDQVSSGARSQYGNQVQGGRNFNGISRSHSMQNMDLLRKSSHSTTPLSQASRAMSSQDVQVAQQQQPQQLHSQQQQRQYQHQQQKQQQQQQQQRQRTQQQQQSQVPTSHQQQLQLEYARRSQMNMQANRSDMPISQNPAQMRSLENIDVTLPIDPTDYNPNNQGFPWKALEGGWPSTMIGRPHMQSAYKNAYSSTGFDMLGVLMRVATRPNPEINIGSVDLSCAFVVCDAELDDFPIVYCSDNFERLTGYTKHMTLGRNCRFLQSPDGNVAAGVRRKYVDDDSVLYLKNMVNLRREAQISLINYRRGGQPFMNLLTMIPIRWNNEQVKFYVGFQVDLVEQPNAVTNKNPDGSYSINYQRAMTMPRYVIATPDMNQKAAELGQTVRHDEVSAILSNIGSGESEYAKRMWDKVLLENTDDVVHVLSLKGLFQWVSPSALRVLEYEPAEIIGTALSSVCHPSDIVPVTRELKDTSTGASVNVVFRIRRKNSGYMWFEGHGSLHTEQGKGRKSIIMVGRERPVYTLSKSEIAAAGGIGENEIWIKMSTAGMFLFVSSSVRQLLDRPPEELIGVSVQSLMRAESRAEFGRILEYARSGKKASLKHEMINRRGQVLSAFTTLYPGDATEGTKPTFVVAQTRLIKFSRSSQTQRPVALADERHPSDSNQANSQRDDSTPQSGMSGIRYVNTDGTAVTYAGQNGLRIGHQDASLASDDNLFEELKTTKSSSWQYEIRQLEKKNRMLADEVQSLIAAKRKRKRRKGAGNSQKDCANCHTRVTPEWRRGPSGKRDLCNSCGLRWAKLNGRVSPRTNSQQSVHSGGAASNIGSRASASPRRPSMAGQSPLQNEVHSVSQMVSSSHDALTSGGTGMNGRPTEGHAATMEAAAGVPDMIEEGVEPD